MNAMTKICFMLIGICLLMLLQNGCGSQEVAELDSQNGWIVVSPDLCLMDWKHKNTRSIKDPILRAIGEQINSQYIQDFTSPTGKYVIFTKSGSSDGDNRINNIILFDFATLKAIDIKPPINNAIPYDIAWSPSEHNILVMYITGNDTTGKEICYYGHLFVYNMETMKWLPVQKDVLFKFKRGYTTLTRSAWEDEQTFLVMDNSKIYRCTITTDDIQNIVDGDYAYSLGKGRFVYVLPINPFGLCHLFTVDAKGSSKNIEIDIYPSSWTSLVVSPDRKYVLYRRRYLKTYMFGHPGEEYNASLYDIEKKTSKVVGEIYLSDHGGKPFIAEIDRAVWIKPCPEFLAYIAKTKK
ncbi:MAG: hypothetical protein HZA50_15840 [Planctomycetes bacterium]|nr:hypothetical protein [Planctomycetota bacterium]